jgi:integrase
MNGVFLNIQTSLVPALLSTAYTQWLPIWIATFRQDATVWHATGNHHQAPRFVDVVVRDHQLRNGEKKRVKVSVKLARCDREYPTKASVRQLADKILAPLNRGRLQPEASLKVSQYVEDSYFPAIEKTLRPATVDSYRFVFGKLEGKLDIRIRDFRTVNAQRILQETKVDRRTLIHIKAFLSAVFRHAKISGVIDGQNPVTDTVVPGRRVKFQGVAYKLDDVNALLEALEPKEGMNAADIEQHHTAIDVVGVFSLTGLRTSECQGLKYSDYDEQRQLLNVSRTGWQTTVGPTKNAASENSIPVIPLLANIIKARRVRLKGEPDDYIVAGKRGRPLNFHKCRAPRHPASHRRRAIRNSLRRKDC